MFLQQSFRGREDVMAGETVVYHNEMNMVSLKEFTHMELDLFFSLCNKVKEKDEKVITVSFKELQSLSNYNKGSIQRFIKDLKSVYNKLLSITWEYESDTVYEKFHLFNRYKIDKEAKTIEISVQRELKHLLNNITSNFTKFELEEFCNLSSSYAKNMYRLLKQFKTTGYFKIDIDDFRNRLGIPDTYRMTNISQRVLKPINEELSSIFNNLQINKVKDKKGRGGKIKYIEFTFDKQISSIGTKIITNSSYSNTKQPKHLKSRELTPEWLKNPVQHTNKEHDPTLEEDRAKFLEYLKNKED